MPAGENIGEFSYLDYLGEKTLVIGRRFAKFTNVFSCQCFPLYSSCAQNVGFISVRLYFN